MDKKRYKLISDKLTSSPSFKEASAEELRVLIALLQVDGHPVSEEELGALCGISLARTRSSLALWESEGAVKVYTDNISEEFEHKLRDSEIPELKSVTVASNVRDEMLEEMLAECASILEKPALSTEEIKALSSLYTELDLSCEYILTLLSFLKSTKKRVTARTVKQRAESLCERGYKTVEELERYIRSTTKEENDLWEIRKIIGIFNRNLSSSEITYFKKWIDDFGFGSEIISEAYDISAVATGTASLPYMDKILSNWSESGLKTVSECRAFSKNRNSDTEPKPERRRAKSEEPKLRYGSFDIDEAIEAALERSFAADDK